MALGQWDQAEAKALQAQRMNVVPSLTADRADTVLHELAMIKARQATPGAPADSATALAAATAPASSGAQAAAQPGQAQMPTTEPASVVAEREANELLVRGDTAAATAKFTEAERLRAQEQRPAGGEAANPATNVAIAAPTANARSVDPEGGRHRGGSARADSPRPPGAGGTNARAGRRPRRPAPGRGPDALRQAATTRVPARWRWRRRRASRASRPRPTSCSRRLHWPNKAVRSSLYESALDAVRKGDHGRARALLTEVAASGAGLDEGTMQKVQDLLMKLPREMSGKASTVDLPSPGTALETDAEALAAQTAQRRGRHQARRRPPAPGNRPRQGDRPL